MFPTKSLLQKIDCPDHLQGNCNRASCPFGHQKSTRATTSSSIAAGKRKAEHSSEEKIGISPNKENKVARTESEESRSRSPSASITHRNGSSIGTGIKVTSKQGNLNDTKRENSASSSSSSTTKVNGARNAYDASARAALIQEKHSQSQSYVQSNASAHPQSINNAQNSGTSKDQTSELLTAPIIARNHHPTASKVTLSTRQGSLRTYFTTFTSLYAPLVPPIPKTKEGQSIYRILKRFAHQFASEDALSSENKVFKTSNTNPMTYRNSIRTDLVGVVRRSKEDQAAIKEGRDCIGSLGIEAQRQIEKVMLETGDEEKAQTAVEELLQSSPLIGTSEAIKGKLEKIKDRNEGMLTIEKLEDAQLIAKYEQLQEYDYPLPASKSSEDGAGKDVQSDILEDWGLGGTKIDRTGEEAKCERCGVNFMVSPLDPDSELRKACCYHWGKRKFVREGNSMRGPRIPRWTCCDAVDEETIYSSTSLSQTATEAGIVSNSSAGTAKESKSGCTLGPHVFKEDDWKMLHRREAFLSTDTVLHSQIHANGQEKHDILAFDCELIFTTAGMSLARITVLDESGRVVLDQFVRPRSAILDYNTRFSGIRASDIPSEGTGSLEMARKALGNLMNPNTVLIGHGLENDLRAIRLIHTRIVDSVLLFPHRKGLPFRMSLRELALVHLKRHIQTGDETSGHDAEEDARAALDLIRLKYKLAKESPVSSNVHVSKDQSKSGSQESSQGSSSNKKPQTQPIPKQSLNTSSSNLFLPRARAKRR
ncbi:hypothetical protein L7F22_027243 [Adiantum nelumboides]|nr:hypothetical protein [Adiantum nelumboides]